MGSTNIREKVVAILNSNSKEIFLLAMGHRLGISARDAFPEVDTQAVRQARACNELMIAILSQIWAMKNEAVDGYPDSDFLSVLTEKADAGGARLHLRNAIEGALNSMGENEASDL